MGTTQDINRNDLLSQVIRQVSVSEDEAEEPTILKINESFLGFIEITNELDLSLQEEILNSLGNIF